MTRIILTERFRKDMDARVRSARVSMGIRLSIKNLKTIPTTGRNDLPDSIIEAFGENVRKLSSPPFLIVYEYDQEKDTVTIDALIHERQAY